MECLGEYEKAFKLEKKWNYSVWKGLGVAELLERTFHESGWIAYQEELLRMDEEGLWLKDDGRMDTAGMVDRYFILGNYDKVIDWDEERYKINNHDPNLPYISAKMYYDRMKDNPRYIALLKKMNLPVD